MNDCADETPDYYVINQAFSQGEYSNSSIL